jgi:hypothetical protein
MTISFTVEEAFQISGRGTAIVTNTSLSELVPGRRYSLQYHRPDGTTASAEATVEVILRRIPIVTEKFAMVVLTGSKGDFPPGTQVSVLTQDAE